MTEPVALTLNSGSSSLKFGLFHRDANDVHATLSGEVEDVGEQHGRLTVRGLRGEMRSDERARFDDVDAALAAITRCFGNLGTPAPAIVAHRVVHGGPNLIEHQKISPEMIRELESAAAFAPLHVPQALELIKVSEKNFPAARQFACFDTAFHRTLPEAAARFALPRKYWEAGVRRYGFHGLSCESIVHALGSKVPQRLIVAHLGSGASVTAIAQGCSVDTTMGLTPTGGIVMGTRSGDLDPGVMLHLMRTTAANAQELETLFDKQSGLLGLSGCSSDMRELHEASANADAQRAIEIFCRSAKKAIGSFIAILGGLDMLVFTGGIGEHDADVRERICFGLEPLGIALDSNLNAKNGEIVSAAASPARIAVMPSQEDAQMARIAFKLNAGTC